MKLNGDAVFIRWHWETNRLHWGKQLVCHLLLVLSLSFLLCKFLLPCEQVIPVITAADTAFEQMRGNEDSKICWVGLLIKFLWDNYHSLFLI